MSLREQIDKAAAQVKAAVVDLEEARGVVRRLETTASNATNELGRLVFGLEPGQQPPEGVERSALVEVEGEEYRVTVRALGNGSYRVRYEPVEGDA